MFDRMFSPGHEIGFSPDGRFLCMMNNLRENNCSVFDFSDPDPTQLEKDRPYRGSALGRQVSEPIPHGVLARQLEALSLRPSPVASHKRHHGRRYQYLEDQEGDPGHRPDLQTPAITYDGKYVVAPFSGFQRLSSGIAVIDAETDELIGILPSNGGHHDCVIIPTKLEHMKHTRSCTL